MDIEVKGALNYLYTPDIFDITSCLKHSGDCGWTHCKTIYDLLMAGF